MCREKGKDFPAEVKCASESVKAGTSVVLLMDRWRQQCAGRGSSQPADSTAHTSSGLVLSDTTFAP